MAVNPKENDMKTQMILVHRRGPTTNVKPAKATVGQDGKLYIWVKSSGRWWMLSNPSADGGWRSFNVGMPDGFNP